MKYVVVTGGVLSGLGKGIATASLGHLLSGQYKVVPIKCDGYLNVDPGTMNPIEHGEVFVLDDGTEVDMDFGHYERFLNVTCTGRQNLTMGKVFAELHAKEREGKFMGKTVQLVPHASNHIKEWWEEVAKKQDADVCLIEIGGTVGDIENELYLEAARQLKSELPDEDMMFVHLSYVPIPGGVDEQKSKPTQQSVRMLMERGIRPDIILCRCSEPITDHVKKKIANYSNIDKSAVINAIDVDSVYKIPLLYHQDGMLDVVNKKLNLDAEPNMKQWSNLVTKYLPKEGVVIALCGKYTALEDSYASVIEALNHASMHAGVGVTVRWIDTEAIEKGVEDVSNALEDVHGVIVPGGFGSRGIEGKIKVIQHCREQNVPYLGLCYGLQLAVVEFARNVCKFKDAHTTEIDPDTKFPFVDILPDQEGVTDLGGTLRLGAYTALVENGSLVHNLYADTNVSERHRHRYEVNPKFHSNLKSNGMSISGTSPDGRLAEFIELEDHPFFVATQAHPELKSCLQTPAPLFMGLVEAAKKGM